MMQHIKIGEGQAVVDISMQYVGDVERLFELCLLNDVSLTDDLVVGSDFIAPAFEYDGGKVVQLLASLSIVPGSKVDALDEIVIVDSVRDFVLRDDKVLPVDEVVVHDQQCFIDFAMKDLADVERVFELCVLNDQPLTALLGIGMKIKKPLPAAAKKRMVLYFDNRLLVTRDEDDTNTDSILLPPGGIGWMQLGSTFIVS